MTHVTDTLKKIGKAEIKAEVLKEKVEEKAEIAQAIVVSNPPLKEKIVIKK